ncbi:ankyrin repeat protein [Megavirus baoshan]|uniref:Ankyrin repeat protein n=1 Tax=Megavirus baoshan TaxID=2496520 RepID=A0A3Q8U8T6_9VIRU|nr:ankyrin repeat protein [Megavirus baoshan]AZL89913.1 ankyrin repeat protein [Megavirus baoshan]
MYYLILSNTNIKNFDLTSDILENNIDKILDYAVQHNVVLNFDINYQYIIEPKYIFKYANYFNFQKVICYIQTINNVVQLSDPELYICDKFIIKEYYQPNNILFYQNNIDNNITNDIKNVLLWCTYTDNTIELAKYLINLARESKIDLYDDFNHKRSYLQMACNNNFIELVKLLLDNNDYFKFNIESIIKSVDNYNNYDILIILINYIKDNNIDIIINYKKYIPQACLSGNLQLIRYFANNAIESGQDINDILDFSLNEAVCCGYLENVKYLISIGASMFNPKYDLIDQAIINDSLEVIKYLISNGYDYYKYSFKYICQAIIYGYLDTLKFFIDLGVDYSCQNNYLLELAIRQRKLDVVGYLYDLGFRYDEKCRHAFIYICGFDAKIVNFILDQHTIDYDTYLQCFDSAIQRGRNDVVELLINTGYVANSIDYTIMISAIMHNNIYLVKLLVEYGFDMSLKNYGVIYFAYNRKYIDIAEFLIGCIDSQINLNFILYEMINDENYEMIPYIIDKPNINIDENIISKMICKLCTKEINSFLEILSISDNISEIIILQTVINLGYIDLLKHLININGDDLEYMEWALILSVKNLDIMKYLLELDKLNINSIAPDMIIYAKIKKCDNSLKYIFLNGFDINLRQYDNLKKHKNSRIVKLYKIKNYRVIFNDSEKSIYLIKN